MAQSNRRVSSQLASSRTVSYSGGLNERFSRIVNSQKNKNENQPQQQQQQQQQQRPMTQQKPAAASNASVFSRLRGSKPSPRKNMEHRLGRTIGGGIRKKSINNNKPTPMSGVIRGNKNVRVAKRGGAVAKRVPLNGKNKQQQQQQQKGNNKKVTKKPLTAEELDRALDSYMMKDPKSARARLDDDMNAYMAEAEDILMNETL